MIEGTVRALIASFVGCVLRLDLRYSKYTTWVAAVLAPLIIDALRLVATCDESGNFGSCEAYGLKLTFICKAVCWPCMAWAAADTLSAARTAQQNSKEGGVKGDAA